MSVKEKVLAVFSEVAYRTETGKSYPKYHVLSLDIDNKTVSYIDKESGYSVYESGFVSTGDGENAVVTVDFAHRTPKALAAGEADGLVSAFDVSAEVKTLTGDAVEDAMSHYESAEVIRLMGEIARLEQFRDTILSENADYKTQVDMLMSEKAEARLAQHKEKIDSLIATYSGIIQGRCVEFLLYKTNLDYAKPVDEIERELQKIYSESK